MDGQTDGISLITIKITIFQIPTTKMKEKEHSVMVIGYKSEIMQQN